MLKKKNNLIKIFIPFFFLLFPVFTYAEIVINEIMYDFPGTEGNGEHDWIEVVNTGGVAVDLSTYKFFEANTNHTLKFDRGSATIPPGGFAIITSATSTFLADWPSFSGTLFDSSFSLNSTSAGETLVIRTKELIDEDSVTYSSDWGAKDDGNSLQKNASGNWIAALPTPGAANSDTGTTTGTLQNTGEVNTNESQTNSSWKAEPQVYADAGADRTIMAGVEIEFRGEAYGIKKEPLSNAKFSWNFGDGSTWTGKTVSHTYKFPGKYIIALNASSGEYSQGDNAVVTVIAPTISLGEHKEGADGFIEIKNSGERDVDVSGVIIKSAQSQFVFPKGTLIGAKSNTKFANSITGLLLHQALGLFYVNGTSIPNIVQASGISQTGNKQMEPAPVSSSVKSDNTISGFSEKTIAAVEQISKEEAESNSSSNTWLYILGALVVTGAATAGVFLQRKETPNSADEYEILE